MWLCDECVDLQGADQSLFKSFGVCEVCGQRRPVNDLRSSGERPDGEEALRMLGALERLALLDRAARQSGAASQDSCGDLCAARANALVLFALAAQLVVERAERKDMPALDRAISHLESVLQSTAHVVPSSDRI